MDMENYGIWADKTMIRWSESTGESIRWSESTHWKILYFPLFPLLTLIFFLLTLMVHKQKKITEGVLSHFIF